MRCWNIRRLDLAECRRRNIRVTSAGSAFSEDGADYAVGLLMDVLRGVSAADRYVRGGLWPVKGHYPLGNKLGGNELGLLGLEISAPWLLNGSSHLAAPLPIPQETRSPRFLMHSTQLFLNLQPTVIL